jgi:hypothetical protein
MSRARAKPDTGTRLLDLWTPAPGAGAPVGCVATTFTFDAGHFEEECLARFLQMESDAAGSTEAYLLEREEKLSQVFACVLADQRHVSTDTPRSLRWHLLGVRVPPPGIQHSKLTVLLWEKHLRILIGSANLTEPGYRTNFETVVPFDFSTDHSAPRQIAAQSLDYLEALLSFVPRTGPGTLPLRSAGPTDPARLAPARDPNQRQLPPDLPAAGVCTRP